MPKLRRDEYPLRRIDLCILITVTRDTGETKCLAIWGDRISEVRSRTNVTSHSRPGKRGGVATTYVHASETTGASAGHLHIRWFIFFRYRAICGSAAASPPPPRTLHDSSMREIARRLHSFFHGSSPGIVVTRPR